MKKRVVLVAPVPVQVLDAAGPAEVFGRTERVLRAMGRSGNGYAVELVSLEVPGAGQSTSGLAYRVRPFRTVRGEIDTLLVLGGDGTEAACADRALRRFLRQKAPRVRRMGSVCTGAFV